VSDEPRECGETMPGEAVPTDAPAEVARPQAGLRLYAELFATFFKIGAFSFGGGMAMIPYFHREIVSRRKWMDDEAFIDITSMSFAVPGPIATNLATQAGYRAGGLAGAAAALAGMIVPPLMLAVVAGLTLSQVASKPLTNAFLKGAGAAVVGLIAHGAWVLSRCVACSIPTMALSAALVVAVLIVGIHPLVGFFAATVIQALVIVGKDHYGSAS